MCDDISFELTANSHVNNKTVDIAFITDPMYSSQVKTEVLFKEKTVPDSGKDLNGLPTISKSELDPRRKSGYSGIRILSTWHNHYFNSAAVRTSLSGWMGFLQHFTQNGDNWAFHLISVAKSILKTTPVSIHETMWSRQAERSTICTGRRTSPHIRSLFWKYADGACK